MSIMELHVSETGHRGRTAARPTTRPAAMVADGRGHGTGQDRLRRFNQLFDRRYRPMVGLAIGMVDQPSVAEEIVQEAFQRVWTRWDHLEQPSVYLRTAVVNGCHDELRRRRVRRRTDPTLRPPVPAESHYLADALSSVDARRREALILRYYGGRTVPEVAEAMGIPTGTAKSLIHRGLADLRGALA
jgi:DNA-directed RNA polymerase specialized sigma24 family protein